MNRKAYMYNCSFDTDLKTQEEIDNVVKDLISAIKNGAIKKYSDDPCNIESYLFELKTRSDSSRYIILNEEYGVGKYYDDFALAFIISFLIKKGATTRLLFEGEDESWGYEIKKHKITCMSKVWTVLSDTETIITKTDLIKNIMGE